MENKFKKKTEEPEQRHKKQVSLQVIIPIITAGVICLVVCLLLVLSTSVKPQSTQQWAQIATMFLILPAIFVGLAGLAVVIVLASMVGKWNKTWPPVLRNFRLNILNIETMIKNLVQKLAQPIIGIKSAIAGFQAFFKK